MIRARVCIFEPLAEGGYEKFCEREVYLRPLPKDSGATYEADLPAEVAVGWRILDHNRLYQIVSAVIVGPVARCVLTRMASTPGG